MKKKLVVLVGVMAMVALFTVSASAGWQSCTISQIGSTDVGYILVLSPVTGTPFPADTTFVIPFSIPYSKEMLATALTAFANSTTVNAYLNPESMLGGCYALYAVK
jgi:hypothetical protein